MTCQVPGGDKGLDSLTIYTNHIKNKAVPRKDTTHVSKLLVPYDGDHTDSTQGINRIELHAQRQKTIQRRTQIVFR
jgi:hypothetical protein